MRYDIYQAHSDLMARMRIFTDAAAATLSHPWLIDMPAARRIVAGCSVFASAQVRHQRPEFGIRAVVVRDSVPEREVEVHEQAAHVTPFCTLLRFRKEGVEGQPRVLLAAPLSGHFATLLRETVRTMLPEHDVYITDWHNARDVPLAAGRFGLEEYTATLIHFLQILGEGAHLVAVCQPCVSALAAVAIMADEAHPAHPAQPRSLTLMAGPIDTRINPTEVNRLATSRPYRWFETNLISTVPYPHRGAGRRVYPGFLQLAAFMNMNLPRHMEAFRGMYRDLARGDFARAAVTRAFYEEYFSVLDLPAEFYLDTIRDVFQEHLLPRGELRWRGRSIDPSRIRRTALLTVEGERDDICAQGQTMAAQDLCSGIAPWRKRHHLQTGVGHYGVFSGKLWQQQTYPLVREMIYGSD